MKKLKSLCGAFVLIVSYSLLNAQNLIPNSGFEKGARFPKFIYPTTWSQFGNDDPKNNNDPYLKNWQNFKTSDWFYEENKILGIGTEGFMGSEVNGVNLGPKFIGLKAHSGKGFAGFGACEGGQIRLNESIKDKMVKVSFWFAIDKKVDNQIEFFLFENEASSDALANCSNETIPTDFAGSTDLCGAGICHIDAGANPEKWNVAQWYYYESPWIPCQGRTFNWFAFKGKNNTSGGYGADNYLYLDDVSVITSSLCNHPCFDMPHGIQIVGNSSDGVIPNTCIPNYYPWGVKVTNVNSYTLKIFDRWGENIFTEQKNCANGFNNQIIYWNGQDKNNRLSFNTGVYVWMLFVDNCYYDGKPTVQMRGKKGEIVDFTPKYNTQTGTYQPYFGDITLLMGSAPQGSESLVVEPYQDCTFNPNCILCPNCPTTSNKNISPPVTYSAEECLYFSNIDFQVGNGLLHNIYAGDEIVFGPNTNILQGTNFHAYCNVCNESQRLEENSGLRIENNYTEQQFIEPNLKINEYAYPNPTASNLNIVYDINKKLKYMRIMNVYGRLEIHLDKIGEFQFPLQINCSALSIGIYFLVIIYEDGSFKTLKFVKS